MTTNNETPYVETEALLALLNNDFERCEELLSKMLPGELFRLAGLAQMLSDRALGHHHGQRAAERLGKSLNPEA
jgi:hypothetical protein